MPTPTTTGLSLALLIAGTSVIAATQQNSRATWRTDPAWNAGKAEWALYDATRLIYGKPRTYEATIFTNKQQMDLSTTTKAGARASESIEVFKHNVSEIAPTEHYDYRFLTTSFVRADTIKPYKVVASTQEDCGATYRQIVNHDGQVSGSEFCYFPDTGPKTITYDTPARFGVHNALTLTLRDYPFGAQFITAPTLDLIRNMTTTKPVAMTTMTATISEVGDEVITVPYGKVNTHHLRVDQTIGEQTMTSEYWFAADPGMRNVLVQYEDHAGTVYRLKRLAWWAYWSEPRPEPESDIRPD